MSKKYSIKLGNNNFIHNIYLELIFNIESGSKIFFKSYTKSIGILTI